MPAAVARPWIGGGLPFRRERDEGNAPAAPKGNAPAAPKGYLRLSAEAGSAIAAAGRWSASSRRSSATAPIPRNRRRRSPPRRSPVRAGVTPATSRGAGRQVAVGLDRSEDRAGSRPEKGLLKISRRDLSGALAQRNSGATTVSATMIAARMAGIGLFANGGIGGVHRGVAEGFDISGRSFRAGAHAVCVVSAGRRRSSTCRKTLEDPGTPGGARGRLPHLRVSRVLSPLERLPLTLRAGAHGRGGRDPPRARSLGLPRASSSPIPFRRKVGDPAARDGSDLDQALQDLGAAG